MTGAALRPARDEDADAIAGIWHAAWHDAHRLHVPAAVAHERTAEHFRGRAPRLIDATTVAADRSGVLGFVTVRDDELALLFVAAPARGTGVAAALLDHGERSIAGVFADAWLEVVTGNARARAFYARHGWSDAGSLDYHADTASGSIPVATRRYTKIVRT